MCGLVGIINGSDAPNLVVMGLHALQHRAQDFTGVVSSDGAHFYRERGPGIARNVFSDAAVLNRLHGSIAVGHIRYSTMDDKTDTRDNTQPILGIYCGKQVALAHNGTLTNVAEIQAKFPDIKCSTSMDSEYILRLLEHFATGDIESDLARVFAEIHGSYSLLLLYDEALVAVRDPAGNRPLVIGRLNDGYVVASETCAFPNIDAFYLADVEPGTIVTLTRSGVSHRRFAEEALHQCFFEEVYFENPASAGVLQYRRRLGRALEEYAPADADVVVPVPDSANFIAEGYAETGRSGKYAQLILRNHYVGRTFTAATQALRDVEVTRKFLFASEEIHGKRIVIIDDSIVRNTTMPKIVQKVRALGATRIHVRIASPPIRHACRYGMDFPDESKLIASRLEPQEIAKLVGADSLEYLPLEVLMQLDGRPQDKCYACINGAYW